MKVWEFEDKREGDLDALKSFRQNPPDVYGFGHTMYYKDVISALLSDTEPEIDGCEGLKSLEILTATYLSAKDGQTISLPLEC